MTFMSDRHDSILRCIPEFFPESPHSYCIVHLKHNVSSLFPKGADEGLKKKIMNLLANYAMHTLHLILMIALLIYG